MYCTNKDLGYNDLGIRNGNKTFTPELDALINGGVTLSSYYTFRGTPFGSFLGIYNAIMFAPVCAPTRASIQTGRYPWGVGYYDMSDDSNHCVDPTYKMLPQLMKDKGYSTHMIGKVPQRASMLRDYQTVFRQMGCGVRATPLSPNVQRIRYLPWILHCMHL